MSISGTTTSPHSRIAGPTPSVSAPLLLVDDSDDNLDLFEALLRDLGEPLVRAGSAREAMERLEGADFALVVVS